jgi:hypothetical protein
VNGVVQRGEGLCGQSGDAERGTPGKLHM